MSPLNPRDRRALRALLIAVPLFALAYGARPVARAFAERRERIESNADLLRREREALADDSTTAIALGVSAARLEHARATSLSSATRAVTVSRFTDRLLSLARQQDVLLQQVSEMPSDSLGEGWTLLRFGARGEGDLAGLTRLLRALDREATRPRVSRILIERDPGDANSSGSLSADGREVLAIHLSIEVLAHESSTGRGAK